MLANILHHQCDTQAPKGSAKPHSATPASGASQPPELRAQGRLQPDAHSRVPGRGQVCARAHPSQDWNPGPWPSSAQELARRAEPRPTWACPASGSQPGLSLTTGCLPSPPLPCPRAPEGGERAGSGGRPASRSAMELGEVSVAHGVEGATLPGMRRPAALSHPAHPRHPPRPPLHSSANPSAGRVRSRPEQGAQALQGQIHRARSSPGQGRWAPQLWADTAHRPGNGAGWYHISLPGTGRRDRPALSTLHPPDSPNPRREPSQACTAQVSRTPAWAGGEEPHAPLPSQLPANPPRKAAEDGRCLGPAPAGRPAGAPGAGRNQAVAAIWEGTQQLGDLPSLFLSLSPSLSRQLPNE